ncbi:family of nucleotide binding [Cryptosporidium sp. chipmunk genotype I]|uniref:family of nucleotide binding n=1 Tax=Cryptosporidium sp. chipmunk genotype I TaxID=1280935 RepID=UPI00351A5812|nr:family of nucleotide binding [Cryptosporidium sp. chipmunk genotype I]
MNGIFSCFRKEGVVASNSKDSIKIFTSDETGIKIPNKCYKSEYSWYPPVSQGKLIDSIRCTIPQLSSDLKKGSLGRIGIIGGSKEYTGAPYFAGISSLKLGADLCHIFCTPEAAIPIKTYSPELIVHPLFPPYEELSKEEACNKSIDSIRPWLGKMDVIVIGCGLGREKETAFITAELIKICRCLSIPIIVDADGLYIVAQQPELISGYKHCILTPNLVEFYRLEKSVRIEESNETRNENSSNYFDDSSSSDIGPNTISLTHIEISNNISNVNLKTDSSINIPKVLPLGINQERFPVSLSPCERVSRTEWPSTNEDAVLQIHDDGEEINLFHQAGSPAKQKINDTRMLSSNPLNMCFYEHVLNENCIGVNKSNKICNSNALNDSLHRVNEEEFLCITNRVFELSKSLGNICIVLKDKIDIITNGNVVAVCNIAGSYKRSSGQGDILSGVISTLFNWNVQCLIKNREDKQIHQYPEVNSAYGSCLIVRLSAYIAFKKKFRSMLASDIIENIPYVFESIFEVDKHDLTEEASLLLLFNEPQSPKND